MSTPATPWSIRLSLCLYRWLLRLGPPDYHLVYAEPTLQVFGTCCREAYVHHGTRGVLALWLPMFSDVVSGMLAERFSAERMRSMVPRMRRSMILTFGAFIFFGIAYIFLMHIIDPLAPFAAQAQLHSDLKISYAAINWCADIAFLAIVPGGLPILFSIVTRAQSEKHAMLALFAMPLKRIGWLLGLAVLLEIGFIACLIALQFVASGALPQNMPGSITAPALVQLGVLALVTFVMLFAGTAVAQVILRGDIPIRMLRYACIPMGIATLAMGIAMLATGFWLVRLWVDAPQFADSQGLGLAGLRGDIGGSEGVVVVILMMVIAVVVSAFSLRRGLHARLSSATEMPSHI